MWFYLRIFISINGKTPNICPSLGGMYPHIKTNMFIREGIVLFETLMNRQNAEKYLGGFPWHFEMFHLVSTQKFIRPTQKLLSEKESNDWKLPHWVSHQVVLLCKQGHLIWAPPQHQTWLQVQPSRLGESAKHRRKVNNIYIIN